MGSVPMSPGALGQWAQGPWARAVFSNKSSSVSNHQSVLSNYPSVLHNHQSVSRNHESVLRNHPSVLSNHQSVFRNHQVRSDGQENDENGYVSGRHASPRAHIWWNRSVSPPGGLWKRSRASRTSRTGQNHKTNIKNRPKSMFAIFLSIVVL